jgi:hypothetical protein
MLDVVKELLLSLMKHNNRGEVSWYVIGSPSGLSRGNKQANPCNPHDSV